MSTPDLSVQSLFSVKGKIALVTGGGTGIGKTIASALVQNGAKVYIAARKESQLKETVAELNSKGPGSAAYIVANLSSKAGTDALISALEAREPAKKLHILVNNSGISWGASFENVPEDKGWDNVMAVNVKSLFYLTSGLSTWLAKDASAFDPGRVINISSVASVMPSVESLLSADGNGTWSYGVSKAAVNHLTSILAVKLGSQKITVNAICPGVFPTKMTSFAFKTVGGEKIASGQPMGRVGHPSDLAGLALFLASPASAHVTGAHILLDGGATLSSQGIAPKVKL
ncbi:NAD(P)-binding protein [Suillus bovinus]|uniref:NAD(P)-binding protein n=1 Tax=Suillus bovinus TaxID=48563 RepID=UPI001B868602|nr:NAD(P)-binding protein [Suillus bovinus]KAG2132858.1 NAD(P)-binding protein [Suillus bovinus]